MGRRLLRRRWNPTTVWRLGAVVGAGVLLTLATSSATAGTLEVTAADATPAQLAAAGFAGLDGTGIQVGQEEAGSNITPEPLTTNPFLPNNILVVGGQSAGQAATGVTNHATEVAGVMVATPASGQAGISPGARLQVSGFDDQAGNVITQEIQNAQVLVSAAPRTHIVNMSFGGLGPGQTNNGLTLESEFVDWASSPTNVASGSPNNNLFVIAGNEGTPGTPSDAYNALNVGATGEYDAGGHLIYDQAAFYNTTNITSDVSPITGIGRMKTDLVAPGGDPGPGNGVLGTFAAPSANVNQFITTSGEQFEQTNVGVRAPGRPVYQTDDIGQTGLTGGYMKVGQNTAPLQPPPFPATMTPAAAAGYFNGTDQTFANTLAGTSFAAPLVSGAAALIDQYGTNNPGIATVPGSQLDERVVKAILMNGASKTNPDGTPLLDQNGNPWGPALNPQDYTQNKLNTEYPNLYGELTSYTKPDPFTGGNIGIKIGLDPELGTGQLNAVQSLKNYAAGQQGPGFVNPTGWDLRGISGYSQFSTELGIDYNDYTFTVNAGGTFSATLTWNRIVTLNDTNANGQWDPNETFNATNAAGTKDGNGATPLTDLDLEIFKTQGHQLIDYATSDVDNVQYLFDQLPAGEYTLEVLDFTPDQNDTYALAWSVVPEPSSLVLVFVGLPLLWFVRRRAFAQAA